MTAPNPQDQSDNTQNTSENVEEQSFAKIIVHSFFIIPFLILVLCGLIFGGVYLLTRENRTAYDYLEDVKTGGLTKRWQGAFELSKILSNPKLIPNDPEFVAKLIGAFEHSQHDDDRVRQYLALAMGRTKNTQFVEPLLKALENKDEKDENIMAVIYALGMLQDKVSAHHVHPFTQYDNPRMRSIAIVTLGNIANPDSIKYIKNGLQDGEANVQWGSAISLAYMNDDSGRDILLKLMNRKYLNSYPEVDENEQKNLIISAIEAAAQLNDEQLNQAMQSLAENDKNMKVRSAALNVLKKQTHYEK